MTSNLLKELLAKMVSSTELHARWLNTLSFLENCGARKIAACEHPTLVKEEMLKHAAEEFRHAHHLKKQIAKVLPKALDNYSLGSTLGGFATLHYLNALDVQTSRFLKTQNLTPSRVKEAAYLLVTYAIELRAEELYPLYHDALRKAGSKVTVMSILLEEKEHLREMQEGLQQLPSGLAYAAHICTIEQHLCKRWLENIAQQLH